MRNVFGPVTTTCDFTLRTLGIGSTFVFPAELDVHLARGTTFHIWPNGTASVVVAERFVAPRVYETEDYARPRRFRRYIETH